MSAVFVALRYPCLYCGVFGCLMVDQVSAVGATFVTLVVDVAADAIIGALAPTASAPIAIAATGVSRIRRGDFFTCLLWVFFEKSIFLPLPRGSGVGEPTRHAPTFGTP